MVEWFSQSTVGPIVNGIVQDLLRVIDANGGKSPTVYRIERARYLDMRKELPSWHLHDHDTGARLIMGIPIMMQEDE